MKLQKVHTGIRFYEHIQLDEIIYRKNIKLRQESNNQFQKDFFKLMSNLVFGKTFENITKTVHVELVKSKEKALKLWPKPNFESVKIFDPNLVAIYIKNTDLF